MALLPGHSYLLIVRHANVANRMPLAGMPFHSRPFARLAVAVDVKLVAALPSD